MAARLRKHALTAHIAASVGWLGAVMAVLALAIAGLTSEDPELVRGSYLAMEVIGWYVLLPLSVASLLTGVVQSLSTKWGLLQHYWVVAKLLINLVATGVLLLYMQTLAHLAEISARPTLSEPALETLRSPSPVLHAGAALVLLVLATILAVFKPRGLTRHGRRKQRERRATTDYAVG